MIEQYRGYEIKVFWSEIEQGYVFCIFTGDGTGIIESNVYHYEKFALLGAKETVDRYIEVKERRLDRWTILKFTSHSQLNWEEALQCY